MPLAGRLCQIFSSRNYIFASIIIQCIGLLITSVAPTLWMFLVGRVFTGIGSAAITPVALILVTELTSKRRRGLFIGLVNTGYTIGVSCGAIIAGALEPVVGWRAVFWLQIPMALAAGIAAFVAIPKNFETGSKKFQDLTVAQKLSKIDYFGVITMISSLVLFLYAFTLQEIEYTPIILSALMLLLFIFVESHHTTDPIVPVAVLKSRGNFLTGLATTGLMTARWGVLFYTPVYAIAVRGWSQASAGLMLLPTNGGFATGGILVGWLHVRRAGSFYIPSLVTYILFAVTLYIVAQLSTSESETWAYIIALFANGFCTGAALNYTLAHVLHLTIPVTHVIVIPLNAMFRGLSGSFGSAIGGGFFARVLRSTLETDFKHRGLTEKGRLIRQLLGTPALVKVLVGVEKEVAVGGYTTAVKTLFVSGSILALVMTLVQAGTGWTAPQADAEEDGGAEGDSFLEPVTSREPFAG
jgi:predicted MFS family arabinose efflux permease